MWFEASLRVMVALAPSAPSARGGRPEFPRIAGATALAIIDEYGPISDNAVALPKSLVFQRRSAASRIASSVLIEASLREMITPAPSAS